MTYTTNHTFASLGVYSSHKMYLVVKIRNFCSCYCHVFDLSEKALRTIPQLLTLIAITANENNTNTIPRFSKQWFTYLVY